MSKTQRRSARCLAACHAKQWVAVYDRLTAANDLPIDSIEPPSCAAWAKKKAFPPLRVKKCPDGNDYQPSRKPARPGLQLLGRAKTHRT